MAEVRIVRLEQTKDGALGSMVLLGELFCTTLEPDSGDAVKNQIPAGVYLCRRFHGSRWPNTFEILVPGHSAVLFHAGNTESDSQMCVLLGQYPGKLNFGGRHARAVLNSGVTFKRFLEILKDQEEFTAEFVNMF